MRNREQMLLLLLCGVGGFAAWLWFTNSGRALTNSAVLALESNMQRLVDMTDSTLQTIINFESFSATPYRDAAGWSIAYGHYMGKTPTMQNVTRDEGYEILRNDAQTARDAVMATINQPMTQNEFDAMVSLAYNIGAAGFGGSTVARLFNAGDKAGAANAFRMWNKSQGSVNASLVDRREKERAIFLA